VRAISDKSTVSIGLRGGSLRNDLCFPPRTRPVSDVVKSFQLTRSEIANASISLPDASILLWPVTLTQKYPKLHSVAGRHSINIGLF